MLTPEQKELRTTGFGSSDVADIVLGNGLRTWLSKTGQAEAEAPLVTRIGRNPMFWGNVLEGPVIQVYAEETGAELYYPEPLTQRHPKKKLALSTPDRLARFPDANAVVECKTTGGFLSSEWEDGGLPERHIIQGTWHMGVTGLKRCDVPVLIGGQNFQIRRVEWSEERFEALYSIVERFWVDYVETKKYPPVDGSDEWSNYLARLFPKQKPGLLLEPTEADGELAEEARYWSEAEKQAKKANQAARNKLKLRLGEAEGLRGLCTYKWQDATEVASFTRKAGRVLRLAKEK